MHQATQQPVHIYLEANPNPNSLKFVLNFMILPDGVSVDYPDVSHADNSPLAQKLFALAYVDRVFYMSNFITVTKKENVAWPEVQNEVKNLIQQHLDENDRAVLTEDIQDEEEDTSQDSDLDIRIKGILDEYIRPAVEQDGGAITFQSFNEGVVKVQLQGSCSGCPSSTVTLKAGIENLLKRMVPEVKEVEAEGV